jgi:hypothetical protein
VSIYKEAYVTLFNQVSISIKEIDSVIENVSDSEVKDKLYQVYEILTRAQQKTEEIIVESDEEI